VIVVRNEVILCIVFDHVTFDFETSRQNVARGVGNLPTNFGVSRTFFSRLISQHLSDASRDLATLTFEVTALVTS